MKKIRKSFLLIIFLVIFSTPLFKFFNVRAVDLRNKVEVEEEKSNSSVVRIYTAGAPGSGVIIGKNKNIYTLVTAAHVIDLSNINEIEIQDSRGDFFKVIEILKPFPDKDIAFIKFKAAVNIPIAIMPFLDNNFWNQIEKWNYIFVEGIANESKGVPQATRRSSGGQLVGLLSQTKDGYNLLHTANTNVGMSGGAIYGQMNSYLRVLPYSKGSEMKYKYVTQDDLKKITTKRSGFIEEFLVKLSDNHTYKVNALYEEITNKRKEILYPNSPTENFRKDIEEQISSLENERSEVTYYDSFSKYGLVPEFKSDLFSKSEKDLYKKCVSGSWRDDPKITANIPLKNAFDEAGYRGASAWGYRGNSKQKKEYDERGKPRYFLAWDCLSAINQVFPYQYEVCNLNSFERSSLKYLLLGVHGRSERYTYGGKSGTGLGLFLGEKDISNWLRLNGKKLGIKLTNGETIPRIMCNKN